MANWIRKWTYQLMFYYQKIQYYLMSIMIIGIADYFILYELSIYLMSFATVGFIPILIVVFSIILIRGLTKWIRRKMKENKYYAFL